jgi:type VI secretion system protein ImpC
MAEPISFGEMDFNVVASMDQTREKPGSQAPFRILILGDFSGRGSRRGSIGGRGRAEWRAHAVDRDNLDAVLARLRPELELRFKASGLPPIPIPFQALDDFHPDSIFERLSVFQSLRETRAKIGTPEFAALLAAAGAGATKATRTDKDEKRSGTKAEPPPESAALSGGNLLDQVLASSAAPGPDSGASADASDWGRFLREIVRPHLVPDVEPQIEELRAGVDEGIAALMRAILHHPDFQALEAAWRGVDFLVRRLETDERLSLHLLDSSPDELAADLAAAEGLGRTRLYKLIVEQAAEPPGAEPWALVAGNFTFSATRDHAELLGRLAKVARAAGAPFIAAAHSRLLGCNRLQETPDPDDWKLEIGDEDRKAWQALRALPEAAYLGLALPRFLLRLPYGPRTDPTDRFELEEMSAVPAHADYLWGNPCWACAYLLGYAFSDYGWSLRPGVFQEIDGLPLHTYEADGEVRITPCAEVLLTEHAAERILAQGIMPLLSFRERDRVRLARFQSLADPPAALAGRWSETMPP